MINNNHTIYLVLFILLLVMPLTYAAIGGQDDDHIEAESSEDLQQAIDNEQSATTTGEISHDGHVLPEATSYSPGQGFSTSEGNYISGNDGNRYSGNGLIIENGQIQNAEDFKVETSEGSAEGRNTQNMQFNGNDYTIGSAEFWETPTHTVISGQNIQKQGDELTVGEGETVDTDEELGSHVQEYESDDEGFSLGGAKAVVLDDTIFTDIKDSSFKTDNDELVEAEITSASDNNSFSFKDIDVNFDKDDTVQLKKNKTTGKYDVSVDSENGTVEDYEGNVACADVSPGSRYRYQDGETNEHFGLYVPSSAESFKLCIKT